MATIYRHDNVTITGSSTVVAQERFRRFEIVLKNTSSDTISLAFNDTAVAGNGVILQAGDSYVIEKEDELHNYINAISSGTSSTLAVFERYLDEV